MKTNIFYLSTITFILSSCSTVQTRVMPMEDGTYKITATDYDKGEIEKKAVDEAEKYCGKENKKAVFVTEGKAEYTGKMDEGTRTAIRKGSKAAIVLSGPVGVGSNSGTAGGILGAAGAVGVMSTNDRDYKAEFRFRCK